MGIQAIFAIICWFAYQWYAREHPDEKSFFIGILVLIISYSAFGMFMDSDYCAINGCQFLRD